MIIRLSSYRFHGLFLVVIIASARFNINFVICCWNVKRIRFLVRDTLDPLFTNIRPLQLLLVKIDVSFNNTKTYDHDDWLYKPGMENNVTRFEHTIPTTRDNCTILHNWKGHKTIHLARPCVLSNC